MVWRTGSQARRSNAVRVWGERGGDGGQPAVVERHAGAVELDELGAEGLERLHARTVSRE